MCILAGGVFKIDFYQRIIFMIRILPAPETEWNDLTDFLVKSAVFFALDENAGLISVAAIQCFHYNLKIFQSGCRVGLAIWKYVQCLLDYSHRKSLEAMLPEDLVPFARLGGFDFAALSEFSDFIYG